MRAAGEAKRSWCVAANYRSRLIRAGQPVLFWVSAHPQRGVWGAGRVTGDAFDEDGRLQVPVHIPLFDQPLTAAELLFVRGLASMEVFRAPQHANPSWVTVAEMALLAELFPSHCPSAGVTPAQRRAAGADRDHEPRLSHSRRCDARTRGEV